MNKYQVITLFPDLIEEWKKVGIINQALKNNLIEINLNYRLSVLKYLLRFF